MGSLIVGAVGCSKGSQTTQDNATQSSSTSVNGDAASSSPQAPEPVSAPAKDSPDANQKQLLELINASRASAGLPPYAFSATQSSGTGSCVGSHGHSVEMQEHGAISHDQFPNDICVPFTTAGENVGEASGSIAHGIQTLHQIMMNEGPSGGHYQNIMHSAFTTVGIGLYYVNGVVWITEDFVD